jgi:nucleoside-diphosphate-sugar epimerase
VAGHCLNLGFEVVGIDDLSGGSIEVKCFVFTSSSFVYGENQGPFSEDAVPKPQGLIL